MELCLKLFLLPASHGRVPNLDRSPALDLVLAQGQPRRLDPDLVLDQSRRVRAENRWRKSPRRLRRLRRRKRLRKWSESARPRPKGASQRGNTTKEPKRRPRFAGGDDPPASELTDSITKLRCLFVSLLKTLKDFVSTISHDSKRLNAEELLVSEVDRILGFIIIIFFKRIVHTRKLWLNSEGEDLFGVWFSINMGERKSDEFTSRKVGN